MVRLKSGVSQHFLSVISDCRAYLKWISCVLIMADTSSYSVEEQWAVNTKCMVHKRPYEIWTMTQVMKAFCEWFNKVPPQKLMLLDGEICVFILGSVKDGLRNGRRKTRLTLCAVVAPLFTVVPRNWHRNNHQILVFSGQHCSITWRKTWILSPVAHHSQMNCQILTGIDTVTHVHWLTLSPMLLPAQCVCTPMSAQFIKVPVTEMCLWLRRTCISRCS
jgi:hypothetical protein